MSRKLCGVTEFSEQQQFSKSDKLGLLGLGRGGGGRWDAQ